MTYVILYLTPCTSRKVLKIFFKNSQEIKKSINYNDMHNSSINNFMKVIQFENFFPLNMEDSSYQDIQSSFFNNINTDL